MRKDIKIRDIMVAAYLNTGDIIGNIYEFLTMLLIVIKYLNVHKHVIPNPTKK
jgi:hypothetical protein